MIEHPDQALHALGHLHDARIQRVELNFASRRLHLVLDDIDSNFEGLPGYTGARPGTLRFADACLQSAALRTCEEPLWISQLAVSAEDAGYRARLVLTSGDQLEWTFAALEIDAGPTA